MRLPETEARLAIEDLIACLHNDATLGKVARGALRKCTSCFACNLICPEDCRPANLFLDLWHRQYEREGLPVQARYFLPHSVPNFRTHVLDRLPADEKQAVESWKDLAPANEIFYPGCNIISTPYLTFSKLFDGLPIRGALEYCCGEMYFRMGLYDQLEQVAQKTTRYFRKLEVKRVHMLCTAGLNLFTNVLPQFGADFSGIEFVPFLKGIYEKLASGALPIVKRFDGKTISIQDSCHAKVFEKDYCDWPRKILALIGFDIREAPQHAECGLCCGIGSGFSHDAAYGLPDLIRGQRACAANARKARADYIAVYCSGCLEMLSVAKYVYWTPEPVYHVIELVQEAIGETPRRRQRKIARDFLLGTLRKQNHGSKRFFIPRIE